MTKVKRNIGLEILQGLREIKRGKVGRVVTVPGKLHSFPTMKTLPQVTEARYVSGYRIELVFNTGLRKTVDFSRWLDGPVFEPLRNRSEFRKFFVAGGTVCWPNGADIAPETLFVVPGVSERVA